jgi:hypothetical protein
MKKLYGEEREAIFLFRENNYSSAPVSTGNTFQDLPRLRETADNTERYI